MTPVDTSFIYRSALNARELKALDSVREVYGVRRISLDERAHIIFVEYDASRLTENDIAALLRDAGIDLHGQQKMVPLT